MVTMQKYDYQKIINDLYEGKDIIELYKNEKVIKYDKDLFNNSCLSGEEIKLLCYLGLPKMVGPGLSFLSSEKNKSLLSSKYKNSKKYKKIQDNIYLGEDAWGDYLCINIKTNEIKLFSHELEIYEEGFERKVNNSMEQFFKSILRFKLYTKELREKVDIKLILEDKIPLEFIKSLKDDLEKIDSESFKDKSSFWAIQINMIEEMVQNRN